MSSMLDAPGATNPAPPPRPPVVLEEGERLYELVNGVRTENLMGALSVWVASRLFGLLFTYLESRGLGTAVSEMVFVLDRAADLRRRPDVAFVSAERWPLDRPLPEVGEWEVVPDLAVEVTSPRDVFADVLAKVREYFRHGIREVWLVVPEERQILRYRSATDVEILTAVDQLDGAPVVPGWQVPVERLFQRTSAPAGPPT